VTLDSRYRIASRIAHGGMATVYAGHDLRLDRPIAVKVLHPHLAQDANFAARFISEAQQAARINHPNVVAVHDQGLDGTHAFIVMELVRGHSVRTLVRSVGRLTPEQTLALLSPIAAGLAAAHESGVLHRDLKPENVLISEDGRVKLTDFGLARAASDTGPGLTGLGGLAGTAAYLSPEYVEGQPTDVRSDLYSLGIVAFELLTGNPPFLGDNPLHIALAHSRNQVPTPSTVVPDIPGAVDKFVGQLTAREPSQRYADVVSVIAELRNLRASLPAPSPLPRPRMAIDEFDAPAPTLIEQRPTQVMAHEDADSIVARGRRKREEQSDLPRRKPRRLRRRIAAALLISAAFGGGVWAWQSFAPIQVPPVVGISQTDAAAALTHAGFTEVRISREFSTQVPAGAVIRTVPSAGSRSNRTEPVTVVISRGQQVVRIPALQGLALDVARNALETAGVAIGDITQEFDERIAPGRVVTSTPKSGSKVSVGSRVALTVSKGPAPIAVPDIVNKNAASAIAASQSAGFKVARNVIFSDSTPTGQVISVSPKPGSLLPRGTTITVTISKGPAFVTVPNLYKLTEAQAKAKLKALGLKVRVYAPAGRTFNQVVRQSSKSGSQVRRGTTVTITVV
jgi:serine/threonine-protein kinase